MTNELLSKLVQEEVRNAFEVNQDVIIKQLSECVPSGGTIDLATSAMIVEAMMLATRISVQLVIKILESADLIALPPDGTPLLWTEDKE